MQDGSLVAALKESVGGDLRKFFGAVVVVFVALAGLAWLAKEPITTFASAVITAWGLLGIFAASLVGEVVPPLGFQPALILGHTGGIDVLPLFFTVEGGSLVASLLCWGIGASLRRSPAAVAWLDKRRMAGIFKRHGTAAVGVAALAPMPYGAITMVGAALGLAIGPALRGMLLRPVKIGMTLLVLWLGWS